MLTVRRSDAAKLAIEELAAGLPDDGVALNRELDEIERTLSVFPHAGKEFLPGRGGRGIRLYWIVSPSGKYQVVYFYSESATVLRPTLRR